MRYMTTTKLIGAYPGFAFRCMELLPPDANAAQQILEPRVGAQWVEAGAHENARVKALRISFFEPGHGLILVAQSYIDHGYLGSI